METAQNIDQAHDLLLYCMLKILSMAQVEYFQIVIYDLQWHSQAENDMFMIVEVVNDNPERHYYVQAPTFCRRKEKRFKYYRNLIN
jgi:hypothetical protein